MDIGQIYIAGVLHIQIVSLHKLFYYTYNNFMNYFINIYEMNYEFEVLFEGAASAPAWVSLWNERYWNVKRYYIMCDAYLKRQARGRACWETDFWEAISRFFNSAAFSRTISSGYRGWNIVNY